MIFPEKSPIIISAFYSMLLLQGGMIMDELMVTIFVWLLPVLLAGLIISLIKRNGWFERFSLILYLLFVTTAMLFVFSNPVEWYHDVYIISFVSLFYFWCVFTYYMVKDKSKKMPVVFSIIAGALMIVSSYFNPEPGMLSETFGMLVAFFILSPIAAIIFSMIIALLTGNVRSSKLVEKARGKDKKAFSEYKLPTYSVGVSVPIIYGMEEYRLVGDSSILGDLFMRFVVFDKDGKHVQNEELIGKVAEPISEILLFKALHQPVNLRRITTRNTQTRLARSLRLLRKQTVGSSRNGCSGSRGAVLPLPSSCERTGNTGTTSPPPFSTHRNNPFGCS